MPTPLFDEADYELDADASLPSPVDGVGASEGDFWRSRIVGFDEVDPALLAANPLNWRTHPEEQAEAIAGSLGAVGFVDAIKFNIRTGRIIDGHERARLAAERGVALVPRLLVDLSEEEERLVLATFDPIGALAQADDAVLAELLAETETEEPALRQMLDELAEGVAVDDVGDDFTDFEDYGTEEAAAPSSDAPSGRTEPAAFAPSGKWQITIRVDDATYRTGAFAGALAAFCQSFGVTYKVAPK